MSSAGQIDPLAALAVQQGAASPQQGGIDPLKALAQGQTLHAMSPPQAANSNSGWADPAGYLSAAVKNAYNAATFNLGDPSAAAIGAFFPIQGWTSTKPTYGERYNELLKVSRDATQTGQQAHPYVSLGGSIAGGMLNPAVGGLGTPKSLGGALVQGAGIGGAYGAGQSVADQSDLQGTEKNIGVGLGLGGLTGTAAYGLGKILTGAARDPQAQLLADEGVPLTPGQSVGGTAKTLEDASTHIPLLGNAIKARQGDAITGFNRAAYNRVLEPLGLNYASDGPIGNEGIDKISGLISDAYDKAYKGASVMKSQSILDGIDSAADEASNLLPKDKVAQINANIERLITSKFDENGILNSNDFQTAKNFFAQESRAPATASLEDRATAGAYGKVVDALKSGIAETDPERGAMLNAADKSFMLFERVKNAASTNASSGKGGIFTPAQLGQALRASDNSTRHIDFATGSAPMQDLAQAGQKVLPSSVPDSGTATRGLMEAAPWLLAGAATRPVETGAAATALGAGTALYSQPGQALARALLHGAPAARKAMGQIPLTMMPGVIAALQGAGTGGKP